MSCDQGPLGIVAGGGRVPIEIAEAVRASGRAVYILAIDPTIEDDVANFNHDRISIGQVGRMVRLLRANGCRDIIISGSLSRPDLRALKVDFGFLRYVPKILALMRGGDDHVLRRVIRFFEGCGFRVLGIPDVAPTLLAGPGDIGGAPARDSADVDTACGLAVIRHLGPFDIGQAVVVRGGDVIAIEAVEGTDGMLARLADDRPATAAIPATLVKATKPGQELRIDLPTIGPRTIDNCLRAAIDHIAIESGRSVIADRELTIKQARELGVALHGVEVDVRPDPAAGQMLVKPPRLICLTKQVPNRKAGRDIEYAWAAARQLAQFAACASIVSSRQQALAIGLDEPLQSLSRRVARRKQWSDKRSKKRRGILAITGPTEITSADLEVIASAGLAGILLVGPEPTFENEAQCLRTADNQKLIIIGPP